MHSSYHRRDHVYSQGMIYLLHFSCHRRHLKFRVQMAFGPTLGSLLIRTTQSVLSVFYLATSVHLLYAFLAWFVMPESLTKHQMQESAVKHNQDINGAHEKGFLLSLKKTFRFLSPLSVFIPELVETSSNPLKGRKRDWNLTLLAIAYGLTISIMVKHLYFLPLR